MPATSHRIAQSARSNEPLRRRLPAPGEVVPGAGLRMQEDVGRGFFDVRVRRATTTALLQREPDDAGVEAPAADAEAAPMQDPTSERPDAPATTPQPPAQAPQQVGPVTQGGHRSAPAGLAACPDPPLKTLVVVGCATAPASAPPAKEEAVLPAPVTADFGGDAMRATFAKDLARCRAERTVDDVIAKRFAAQVEANRKQATAEAKAEADEALQQATEGLTDKREIARATATARAEAKTATAKKIKEAVAATKKEDIATVTSELAVKFEAHLKADYETTIRGALAHFGPGWKRTMQQRLDANRKKATTTAKAKPKVRKGETPPPAKSPEDIEREIEATMTPVRCEQQQWVLQNIEDVARAWAVGRREEVDFDTIKQKVSGLGKFEPTYLPTTTVEIPADVREAEGMAGVAPEMADFLSQLNARPNTPPFRASNRAAHGGGTASNPRHWSGKGFSVDLFLHKASTDLRGFWQHDTAVTFLLELDATAKAMGARWRVLYDDFRVAEEVNAATGTANVVFMGVSSATRLNWHGPAGLILHFHLDLEIPRKAAPPARATPQGSAP